MVKLFKLCPSRVAIKSKMKQIWNKYKESKFLISPLFLLFGTISFFVGRGFIFLVCTISAVLHELGHAFISKKLGYKISQIKLMPYGAELNGEFDEFVDNDEIKIAIAGPMTNFIICIICCFLWWVFPSVYMYTLDFCIASLIAGLFNILPIFPLDGGRVVLALLTKKMKRNTAVKLIRFVSIFFAFFMFFAFAISFNLTFVVVGIFLFVSAIIPNKNAVYKRVLLKKHRKNLLLKGLESKNYYFKSDATLLNLFNKTKPGHFTKFTILSEKEEKICQFSEIELEKFLIKYSPKTTILEIIHDKN